MVIQCLTHCLTFVNSYIMNNNRASWECYINTTVMCNLSYNNMWTFWRNVTEEIECYIIREMFRVCDNFECDCTDISWYDSVGLIRVPTRSEWITHNLINFIAVMGKMCVLQIMLRLDSFMLYIEYNFSLLSTHYILVIITVDITIGQCPFPLSV